MADTPELFDRLPERFFESLREQMMLGMLPSEEVEELLEPCLSDHEAVMARLPLSTQNDIENILRIYPEIGAKYGVVLKPTLVAALDELWRKLKRGLRKHAGPPVSREPHLFSGIEEDIAAETQKPLRLAKAPSPARGRAHLPTDRGSGIDFEFSYEGVAGRLFLRSPSLARTVHIVLGGRIALTLSQEKPEGCVDVESLMMLFETDVIPDLEVEIREERAEGP